MIMVAIGEPLKYYYYQYQYNDWVAPSFHKFLHSHCLNLLIYQFLTICVKKQYAVRIPINQGK